MKIIKKEKALFESEQVKDPLKLSSSSNIHTHTHTHTNQITP